MFTGLSTRELDVALHPVESQSLVRGRGRSNGLDAILDIEVKGLSALGRFVSPQLEGREARKTKLLLMCPEEQMTARYQCVVSPSSCDGRFPLEGQSGHYFVFVQNIH